MLLFASAMGIAGPPAIKIDLFNRPDATSFGSDWTPNFLGGSGGISNAYGYITTSSGNAVGGATEYFSAMPSTADQEVYVETPFTTAIAEGSQRISARVQNAGDISSTDYTTPTTGYTLSLIRSTGEVQLFKQTTSLGKFTVVSGGFPANTTWSVRWLLNGSSIKWRVWQKGTTEPSTWNQELTDTTWTAAGRVMLSGFNGTDGPPRTYFFNDLRITAPVAVTVTGQIKVYLGSSFVAKPAKVWNGTAWVKKDVKVWTGSAWKITNY